MMIAPHPTPALRTILFLFLGLCGTVVVGAYVIFQARYLITGPQIVLTAPPPTVSAERVVTLSGTAYNIARLWLNDRQIFTDAQGNFAEALVLENGYTVATLKAEDRYGRTREVHRELVYRPMSVIP